MKNAINAALVVIVLVSGFAVRSADAPPVIEAPRVVRFAWTPPGAPAASYELPETEDQHQLVIYPGAKGAAAVPVVLGFHGQPRRGKAPRNYAFAGTVRTAVDELVATRRIPPVVLVLPVFRYEGANWPGFDTAAFFGHVRDVLHAEGLKIGPVLVFGHSGAAGCGGQGLNEAHRLGPTAVGFFDTCLGRDWQREVRKLEKEKIKTVNLHSVETAGFRPRQRPEYQATFDFGRAYKPLDLRPVTCPVTAPAPLRDQTYKCAATANGVVEAFVVDTGDGEKAHEALLPVAVKYFLSRFL